MYLCIYILTYIAICMSREFKLLVTFVNVNMIAKCMYVCMGIYIHICICIIIYEKYIRCKDH